MSHIDHQTPVLQINAPNSNTQTNADSVLKSDLQVADSWLISESDIGGDNSGVMEKTHLATYLVVRYFARGSMNKKTNKVLRLRKYIDGVTNIQIYYISLI